ncbi:MAG TPA: bifunctional histidinol-phosphatase/imidazoleglycerol-phosphate dehydratase HisB [Bacteroidales bacterium]|jgi:imidazoleglycerol-phosphate dehydratase/histidinol-phosphatase|nr:bifunctional histidinol-phosphatase/imidazoleglycerol-phosphate dehydratase HisB [Bacteroidales bacterium]
MKKVLFIDRDSTILAEPANGLADTVEDFQFLPGAVTALSGIARQTDFELVMVTNQDGLGTEMFPEEMFWPSHNKMLQILKNEGVVFAEVFIDRSMPEDNKPTRKPGTAMLTRYLSQGIDLGASYVIGDRVTDIQFADNLGCKAIFFSETKHPGAAFCTNDWNEVYRFLTTLSRMASVQRNTGETKVHVELNLDGTGKNEISTGIGFFDHMLEQIARHAEIDLKIKAEGDLHVDVHHTIEDTAIALGECISKALGSKRGIERYGFLLPMDDSLAQTAIDLSGRPWLVWNVSFRHGTTGGIPSEMFFHFFKSFSDNAKCNLNIRAEGENDHHMIEAVFKSFAKALKMAVGKYGSCNLPSTKGIL